MQGRDLEMLTNNILWQVGGVYQLYEKRFFSAKGLNCFVAYNLTTRDIALQIGSQGYPPLFYSRQLQQEIVPRVLQQKARQQEKRTAQEYLGKSGLAATTLCEADLKGFSTSEGIDFKQRIYDLLTQNVFI